MLNKLLKNKRGFTLIELIVVIAILGILAAVMIPLIGGFIEDANVSNDIGEVNNLAGAIGRELLTNSSYLSAEAADDTTTSEALHTIFATGTPSMFEIAGVNPDLGWDFSIESGVLLIGLVNDYDGRIPAATVNLTKEPKGKVVNAVATD